MWYSYSAKYKLNKNLIFLSYILFEKKNKNNKIEFKTLSFFFFF